MAAAGPAETGDIPYGPCAPPTKRSFPHWEAAVQELSRLDTISANSSSLELFFLGCQTLATNDNVIGKLTAEKVGSWDLPPIDVEMLNVSELARRRPHVAEQACTVLAAVLSGALDEQLPAAEADGPVAPARLPRAAAAAAALHEAPADAAVPRAALWAALAGPARRALVLLPAGPTAPLDDPMRARLFALVAAATAAATAARAALPPGLLPPLLPDPATLPPPHALRPLLRAYLLPVAWHPLLPASPPDLALALATDLAATAPVPTARRVELLQRAVAAAASLPRAPAEASDSPEPAAGSDALLTAVRAAYGSGGDATAESLLQLDTFGRVRDLLQGLSMSLQVRVLELLTTAVAQGLSPATAVNELLPPALDWYVAAERSDELLDGLLTLVAAGVRRSGETDVARELLGLVRELSAAVSGGNDEASTQAAAAWLAAALLSRGVELASLRHALRQFVPACVRPFAAWPDLEPATRAAATRALLELGAAAAPLRLTHYKLYVLYFPAILERLTPLPRPGELLRSIIAVALARCRAGHDPSDLLSDGVPMVLRLAASGVGELRPLLDALAERFDWRESYSAVMKLRHGLDFAQRAWPDQERGALSLWALLIRRGSRADVRLVHELFRRDLAQPLYQPLMRALLGASRPPDLAEFRAVAHLLLALLHMATRPATPAVPLLVGAVLDLAAQVLVASDSRSRAPALRDLLTRLVLFRTLHAPLLLASDPAPLLAAFAAFALPSDVAADSLLCSQLHIIARRIERVLQQAQPAGPELAAEPGLCERSRAPVAHAAMEALRALLREPPGELPAEQRVAWRRGAAEEHVRTLPENVAMRAHLQTQGYHELLWGQEPVEVMGELDERASRDAVLAAALVSLYSEELGSALQAAGVSELEGGLPLERSFAAANGLEGLRSRRNVALATLASRAGSAEAKARLTQLRATVLAREQQLEAEHRKRARGVAAKEPRRYRVRLLAGFLETAASTDDQIAGCYAPDGDHAEKPLENGLKANVRIASLLAPSADAPDGWTELENLELACTDQALFIYKLYTCGHQLNTAPLWTHFFRELLDKRYVPALVVPRGYPSPPAFDLLLRAVPAQLYSSVLTFRDSFFQAESYYDLKPERIRAGDLLLTDEAAAALDPSAAGARLLSSSGLTAPSGPARVTTVRLKRDLAGTLVQELVRRIRALASFATNLDTLAVFGRYLAHFVGKQLETGCPDPSVLLVGFDLEQWNRRRPQQQRLSNERKEQLVQLLVETFEQLMDEWYAQDPAELYALDRDQFMELKAHEESLVERWRTQPTGNVSATRRAAVTAHCKQLRAFLRNRVSMQPIQAASARFQQDVMKWIFRNEDKVWRERGGRPGEETVEMFLDFIVPQRELHSGHEAFPGVLLLSEPFTSEAESVEIIGYAVGDFTAPRTYEVITAWTSTHYRGLNLALAMYFRLIMELDARLENCTYICCDTILGGYERMLRASRLLRFVHQIGFMKVVVREKKDSYVADVGPEREERFERLVLHYPTLRFFITLYISGAPLWQKLFGHRVENLRLIQPAKSRTSNWKRTLLFSVGFACGFLYIS